jgi:hypothetical protein
LQNKDADKTWLASVSPYSLSNEQLEKLESEHLEGIEAQKLAELHHYKEEFPIRNISKLDILAIYNHQSITLDGKLYLFNLFTYRCFVNFNCCKGK